MRAIIDEALGQAAEPASLAMAAVEAERLVARLDDHRHSHAHQYGDCDKACATCAVEAA